MAIVCIDIDGNEYDTVTIGGYTWTTESLRVTKYNDGTAIPLLTANADWTSATDAYCFYNNSTDPTLNSRYGALYNWFAVNSGKLAPSGWRIPTNNELTSFANYLIANGYNYDGTSAGNKIGKSLASTSEWKSSVVTGAVGNVLSANNSTGFNLYGSGYRNTTGGFVELSGTGYLWSTTQSTEANATFWYVYYNTVTFATTTIDKNFGFSIRLIKDTYTDDGVMGGVMRGSRFRF